MHIHGFTTCRYLYLGIALGRVFSYTGNNVFTFNSYDVR